MSGLIVLHGVRTVQLTEGRNTLIDEQDYPLVSGSNWTLHCSNRPGEPRKNFYAKGCRCVDGKVVQVYLHRWLVGLPKQEHVDHHNGDSLDNRRSNIRRCSPTQNKMNVRSSWGKSKFKGVCFVPYHGKWKAQIKPPQRNRVFLGYYDNEEDAARAYDKAAKEYHGEFACTNKDLYGDY